MATATTTTFTFTNFNRVPKPWAGGPILLPDKVSVHVGYAAAANIAPKPFSALDAANSASGLYSAQNVAAAAASQGAVEVVAETSSVVKSEVNSAVETQSLKKTELKRELSKTVEIQENSQLCSTLEFARDASEALAPAPAEVVAPEAAPAVEAAPSPAPAAAPAAAPAPAPVAAAPPKMPSIPKGPRKPTLGGAGSAKVQQPVFSGKIPVCAMTGEQIRGPFILALGKTFAPDAFKCANPKCGVCPGGCSLQDRGFVEEEGQLFCEDCYESYFAPKCAKCNLSIKNDCVNAMGQTWHPECFCCFHCKQPIGTSGFHIEDGNPYCTAHWNELFTTKCYGCEFPIEPSDRWVEALGQNWHAECFNCAVCGVNLEGQSFYAKGGRPFCKKHASSGFR